MSAAAAAILAALLAVRLIETAVAVLNLRSLRPEMPPEMAEAYDRAAYERSQAYARATARAGLVREWVDLAEGPVPASGLAASLSGQGMG